MRFFGEDTAFSKYGTIIFDLFLLNFIVLSTSILTLGIGFGASVTAMMYAIDRTIFEGRGYTLKNYMKSLKTNWKQASLLWIGAYIVLSSSRIALEFIGQTSGPYLALSVVYIAASIEVVFVLIYAIPTLALIDVKLATLVQNAFVLAHRHFVTTLACISLIGLAVYLTFELHGIFLLFLISGIGLLINQLVVRNVLVRYFTDDQKKALFSDTLYPPQDYDEK